MGEIRSAAVIGAGTMGAGIAAHFANAGLPVLLLDIVQQGAPNRNIIAQTAIERLHKTDPAPLMRKSAARLITPGNIEDDLPRLAEADWIVEAIVENREVKQALYRKLDSVRKPAAIISSNTSTLPLAELTASMPDSFARHFCITHFFNPPRYMRLLEFVGGQSEVFAGLREFADRRLGKTIVHCNDTPGFIANRIGTYWIQTAMVLALEMGLSAEEADAVMGKPFGFPSTGVFGLLDLVGLDLAAHVNASLAARLPQTDAFHAINRHTEILEKLVAEGFTGNKGKGGFYRSTSGAAGKRNKTVLDLAAAGTGRLEWRDSARADIPLLKDAARDLKKLLNSPDKHGKYAWGVLGRVLAYAASLVPEICPDIADIDIAMRLGYTWKFGPFELIDQLGADWVAARLPALGIAVPQLLQNLGAENFYHPAASGTLEQFSPAHGYIPVPTPPGALVFENLKRAQKPLLGNKAASVWDLGDGVLCFEIHTEIRGARLNMLDGDVLAILEKTLAFTGKNHKALVLYNDDLREPAHKANFSTGANIGLAYMLANIRLWGKIENTVAQGQKLYQQMRYAPFPIIGAAAGRALGGGCEMLLHCTAVQAYAESYIGLVEPGVGVVPAWGGCTTMLTRWAQDEHQPRGPIPAPAKVFEILSVATVSRSAAEAMELKFLRESDAITMNRDRLLADAKTRALALAENYTPPAPPLLHLPGPSGRIALGLAIASFRKRGIALDHDVTVSGALADVLTGGDTDYLDAMTEEDVMALERKAFMTLVKTKPTQARIKSIMDTGRPLRN